MLEPSTSDLPLFVTHGTLVGWLALALAIGAGFALVWVARWIAARSAARTAARDLAARRNVVRGVLRGDTEGVLASSLEVEDRRHGTLRLSTRATEIWIQTSSGRVTLEGALDVVVGSRSASARSRVPVPADDALLQQEAAKPHGWPHRFSPRNWVSSSVEVASVERLRAGDEVIATSSTDAELDVLRAPNDGAISLAAARPAASVRGMQPLAKAMVAGALALVGYLGLGQLADRHVEQCANADREATDSFLEIGNGHPCALAATSLQDSNRAAAREHLVDLLSDDWYRDERTVRRLLAVADGCAHQARILAEHGQHEHALERARRCGDRRAEHLQLVALGRFEEAASVVVAATETEPALPRPQTLIAAGRWADAPAAIDPKQLRNVFGELLTDPEDIATELQRVRCAQQQETGSAPDNCKTIDPQLWGEVDAAGLVAQLGDAPAPPHAWLAAEALATLPADAPADRRVATLAWATIGKVVVDDIPSAAKLAAETVAAARQVPDRHGWLEKLELLPAAVALFTPATELVVLEPRPEGWSAYTALDDPDFSSIRRRVDRMSHWDAHRFVGEELAQRLGGAGSYQPDADEILAVLPRSGDANRTAILRQLTWSRPFEPPTFSWTYLGGVIVRRAIYRLAGAADQAARWHAIFRRYDAVLKDRKRLAALAQWY